METILLLLLATGLATSTTYEAITCGHIACIDKPGVSCNAEGTGCVCPSGEVGDARVQCANPHDHCLCVIHGDPHIVNFWGQMFVLPVPCAHSVAQFKTSQSAGRCTVWINGRAWYSDPDTPSFAAFERLLHVKIYRFPYTYTIRFKDEDEPVTTLKYGSFTIKDNRFFPVTTEKTGGFHVFNIPQCKLILKYRGRDSSFVLLAPVGYCDNKGICGKCKKRWDPSVHLTDQEVLKQLLNSLSPASPIDWKNMNIYPACGKLTVAVGSCPKSRSDYALAFCGPMLTIYRIRTCITARLGKSEVTLGEFARCYEGVCKKSLTCSQCAAFYTGCKAHDHVNTYIQKAGFC